LKIHYGATLPGSVHEPLNSESADVGWQEQCTIAQYADVGWVVKAQRQCTVCTIDHRYRLPVSITSAW